MHNNYTHSIDKQNVLRIIKILDTFMFHKQFLKGYYLIFYVTNLPHFLHFCKKGDNI